MSPQTAQAFLESLPGMRAALRDRRGILGPVAYAPTAKDTAYAVGFDGSIWKSTDGGQSWSPVPK